MKISYNWLSELLPHGLSPEMVAIALTDGGLEVESLEAFESLPGGLNGLVVGEVVEKTKHPDADKLSLTKVNIGEETLLDIVCGAPNVAAGQKVVVATVGAKLFPSEGEPFVIKKSKIRGATSEGMLCAEDEIGLGKGHAGIMVLDSSTAVGTPAATYFKVEKDVCLEIGLTPNRSDAASHYGVARDLAAILNTKEGAMKFQAKMPLSTLSPATSHIGLSLQVDNVEACPKYAGLCLTDITVAPSPDWLQNKLKAIGLRPINNIVDITNYVLHELGQPLHAFDYKAIAGQKVVVRTANEGETFVSLDGISRTLSAQDLVIADQEKAMCIAGVFGGLHSGVNETTTSIFLESAYFNPAFVRRTSKRHGLKTDASFRFERGCDADMVEPALYRAAALMIEIAGAKVASNLMLSYPEPLTDAQIQLRYAQCHRLIGKEIAPETIQLILQSLGMKVLSQNTDGLTLSVPKFKTDVTREADVIEEIMRVYGYNNIEPAAQVKFSVAFEERSPNRKFENTIADFLASNGFSEMMATSLTKEAYVGQSEHLVKLLNPLSADLNILRPTAIFSGLEAIAYNLNRKVSDIKLFEFGKTYSLDATREFPYVEEKHLSVFVCGNKFPENPYGEKSKSNVYFLKGYMELMLQRLGITKWTMEEVQDGLFNQALVYKLGQRVLGIIGEVARPVLKNMDIKVPVFAGDWNVDVLFKEAAKHRLVYQEVSRFPEVRRDLALLVKKEVRYRDIEKIAGETERKLLKEVGLFDIYEGDKLEKGKKSYAVSFTLQDEQATLTDKQIEGVMSKLMKAFEEKLGAEIRK